jgi:hypothetical protein
LRGRRGGAFLLCRDAGGARLRANRLEEQSGEGHDFELQRRREETLAPQRRASVRAGRRRVFAWGNSPARRVAGPVGIVAGTLYVNRAGVVPPNTTAARGMFRQSLSPASSLSARSGTTHGTASAPPSRAHRKPTLAPASSTEPQFRLVVRLIEGGDSHPPPRRVWLAPALGAAPPATLSEYQSLVHSSTLPDRSKTPKILAPIG